MLVPFACVLCDVYFNTSVDEQVLQLFVVDKVVVFERTDEHRFDLLVAYDSRQVVVHRVDALAHEAGAHVLVVIADVSLYQELHGFVVACVICQC